MSEFKKCKVIMLPTKDNLEYPFIAMDMESINSILLVSGNSSNSLDYEPQHLYVTSKEQIEEGNWYYNSLNHTISQADKRYGEIKNPMPHRKIVATTDKSLKTSCRCGDQNVCTQPISYFCGESLPQIPQSFIRKYVEAGGINEVELEIEETFTDAYTEDRMRRFYGKSKIKTDSNNYIILKPTKKCWIREEVEQFRDLADAIINSASEVLGEEYNEEYENYFNWIDKH